MKKIGFLLFSLLIFCICIPVYAEENIEIKDVRTVEQSGTIEVEDVEFDSKSISSGVVFHELNDFVTYEVEVENNTSKNYVLKSIESNLDNEYVSIESNNIGDTLNQKDTKKIQITLRYNHELLNQEEFSPSDGVFRFYYAKTNNLINPLTNNRIVFMTLIFIIALVSFLFLYKRGRVRYIVLFLFLIPFFTMAEEGYSFEMNLNTFLIKGRFLNYNVTLYDDNQIIESYQKTYGATIDELPILSQEGYEFEGWKDQNNHEVNERTVVHEDLNLTSQYNPIEYDIHYQLNGGELPEDNPEHYTIEDEFELNNPDSDQTFAGWEEGESDTRNTNVVIYPGTTGDKEFNATYSDNPEVEFTVIHQKENNNGEYEEFERETLQGAAETSITPQPKKYVGYDTPDAQTKILSYEEMTTFTYDYPKSRYSFEITDRTYINTGSTENGTYTYGTVITLSAKERRGYSFLWSDGDTNYYRSFVLEKDTSITPIYIAKTDIPYKVIHKQMNLNGKGYTTKSVFEYVGKTDSKVTPSVINYEGFNSPKEQTVTINGDGTTVVEYLYERNKYQLLLEDENYIDTTTPSGNYYYGTSITLKAKEKSGHDFIKWSNGITQPTYTFTISGDFTIKPIYDLNYYLISFNTNGGRLSPTIIEVEKGQTTNLPIPTKEGYYFDGWYTKSSSGEKVGYSYKPTSDITLYARWKKSVKSISVENEEITLHVGEEKNLNIINAPAIEEEFTFESSDESKVIVDQDGNLKGISEGEANIIITGLTSHQTKTIHVVVTLEQYTITFDGRGVEVNPATKIIVQGNEIGELPSPTKTGYYLDGWYTDLNGDNKINSSFKPTESKTIYARWKKSVESAVLEKNEIVLNVGEEKYISMENASEIEEEYTFNSSNTSIVTVDESGKITGISVGKTNITITGLISHKTKIINIEVVKTQYTITFDANGGIGEMDNQVIKFGEETPLLKNTYTKEGYIFTGWNTKRNGSGVNYSDEETVIDITENITITLYAQWQDVGPGFTVTYNANGGTFSNNETINKVRYKTEINYSHTSNIDETGKQLSDYGNNWTNANITGTERGDTTKAHVVTIPGASQLIVDIYYNGESTDCDWVSIWEGSHPDYTAEDDYSSAIQEKQKLGGMQSETYTVNGNNLTNMGHTTLAILGDTVTFGFYSDVSAAGSGYGYYAIIQGIIPDGTYEEPSREGATYKGWYKDQECSYGQDFDLSENNEDITVYARYVHTIHFDVNGGEEILNNDRTVDFGKRIGNLPTTEKENYFLDGWYDSLLDGTKITEDYVPTSDATLYAIWKKTIYFGILESTSITLGLHDEKNIVFTNPNEVEEEYVFTSNDRNIAEVDSNGKVTDVNEGTTTITITGLKSGKTKTVEVTVKYLKYTISFDSNGGKPVENKKVVQSLPIGTLPEAYYDGEEHLFLDGWYINLTNGMKVDESFIPTNDMTLYAKWKNAEQYTITFNPNGGTVEETSRLVYEDEGLGTLPVPTKENAYFGGWKDEDDNKFYTSISKVTKNTTLTAQWTEVDYVARIDSTYYETLNDAMLAVKNNEEIVLLKNSADRIDNSLKITINLDQHILKGTIINNETGDLTLLAGTLNNSTESAITNNGRLVLGSVDPKNNDGLDIASTYSYQYKGILNGDNTTCIFNKGNITNTKSTSYGIDGTGNVIMNGGNINIKLSSSRNIVGIKGHDITMNDGTVIVTIEKGYKLYNRYETSTGYGLYGDETSTIIMNGGTVSVNTADTANGIYGNNVKITNGIINAIANAVGSDGNSLTSNQPFSTGIYLIGENRKLIIDNGEITSSAKSSVITTRSYGVQSTGSVNSPTIIKMNNGSITSTSNTSNGGNMGYGMYISSQNASDITMNGGYISISANKTTSEGIVVTGNNPNVVMNGGTIHVVNAPQDAYGIYINPASTSTIANATLNNGTIILEGNAYQVAALYGKNENAPTTLEMNGGIIKTRKSISTDSILGSIDSTNNTIILPEGKGIDRTYYSSESRYIYTLVDLEWTSTTHYRVFFNSNGGEDFEFKRVIAGEKIGELPTPTQEGYEFIGWYTGISSGTPVDEEYVPTNNMTIYAHWVEADEYVISFDSNGGSNVNIKHVPKNEAIGTLPGATKKHFYLEGWYTNLLNGQKVDSTYVPEDNITLYAKWNPVPIHTITFDSNGGIVDEQTRDVYEDDEIGKLPVGRKRNYSYNGWIDSSGNEYTSTSKLTDDVTLIVQWSGNSGSVARIDDYFYNSLSDALDDAREGETIVLLKDTSESATNTKNVTLNMNNKTITGIITNSLNGTLTINNGSFTNNVKAIVNNGDLVLNNVNIKVIAGNETSVSNPMWSSDNNGQPPTYPVHGIGGYGNVEVNGGTITATAFYEATAIQGSDVTINGATVKAYGEVKTSEGVYANNKATINSGTISSFIGQDYTAYGVKANTIEYNGGTISAGTILGGRAALTYNNLILPTGKVVNTTNNGTYFTCTLEDE